MKKVQTPLFQGITENEWNEMQNCSCMRQQSFEKNELIFRMGESVREIGIVLTGSVNIENVDLWGNKSLLSNISAGQVFAETYAFCQEPLMVNAVAAEYTNLLFLNLETLMQPLSRYSLDGQDHAESPSNFHLQKSHPVQPDFLHNPKDHSGTSADLSVLSGVQSRKHGLSNSF